MDLDWVSMRLHPNLFLMRENTMNDAQERSYQGGEQRASSGKAWRDYCRVLEIAGTLIDTIEGPLNNLDRAEWYRFLTRLMRHGAERFMENSEPERPRLRDTPWRQAINFQSPDQDHLLCEFIDGTHDYVIEGSLGTIPYFVIASWSAPMPVYAGNSDWAEKGVDGLAEFNPAALRTTGFLQSNMLRTDKNGKFEIIVSRNNPGEGHNWLPIEADCAGLLVRNVYHDRAGIIPPQFYIRRFDGSKPRPISLTDVSLNLARAGQTVLAYANMVCHWWRETLAASENRIVFDDEVYLSNGGVADRYHGFGRWSCQHNRALVIEFTPSTCEYWIFQLCNMWQENLDNYEDGNGYTQNKISKKLSDGTIRVIVAHEDPGVEGNYISPFGHTQGGMSLRLIKPQAPAPKVVLYDLALEELKQFGLDTLKTHKPVVSGVKH